MGIEKTSLPKDRNGSIKKSRNCQERRINNHNSTANKMNPHESIRIVGAKQNNLKNLNLELPLFQIIAITGVSGSGKSSLAIDTIYAEGQRW